MESSIIEVLIQFSNGSNAPYFVIYHDIFKENQKNFPHIRFKNLIQYTLEGGWALITLPIIHNGHDEFERLS